MKLFSLPITQGETNNIQSPVYSSERDTRLSLYVTTINISDNKNNSIFFYYLSFGQRVETCEKNVSKSLRFIA